MHKGFAIQFNEVSFSYGNSRVIDSFNLSVKEGQIHGVLGHNGSGKTTCLKLMTGLIEPQEGDVLINGVSTKDSDFRASDHLGVLLEKPPLYEELKVREYLEFILDIQHYPSEKKEQRLKEILEILELEDVEQRLIANLSRGYKQRVSLAQAIIHDAKIVVLDEPTLGLDPDSVVHLRETIKNLKKDHTIVVSSHHLSEMALICDEVTIVHHGKLKSSVPINEVSHFLSGHQVIKVEFMSDASSELMEKLRDFEGVLSLLKEGERSLVVKIQGVIDLRSSLLKFIQSIQDDILQFYTVESSLEDFFLKVTKD